MYNNNRFIFYEKQYYHELEMKQKIDVRLQAHIVFSLAWLNVSAYLVKDIDFQSNAYVISIFFASMLCFFLLICNSLRFSIFSFYGNIYTFIETPKKLEKFYNDSSDYYKKYHSANSKQLVDERFNEVIMEDLLKTTDNNSKKNDSRSGESFEASRFLVFAAIPFLLALIIHTVYKLDLKHPTKAILIEEKSLKEIFDIEPVKKFATSTTATTWNSKREI